MQPLPLKGHPTPPGLLSLFSLPLPPPLSYRAWPKCYLTFLNQSQVPFSYRPIELPVPFLCTHRLWRQHVQLPPPLPYLSHAPKSLSTRCTSHKTPLLGHYDSLLPIQIQSAPAHQCVQHSTSIGQCFISCTYCCDPVHYIPALDALLTRQIYSHRHGI